jgi:hypothetical protein
VVRKSSDIALLLGSRGRSRGRGGVGKTLRSMFGSWSGLGARFGFGQSSSARAHWRDDRRGLLASVPGWLAAVLVLAAFAGGFLLGGRLQPADGNEQNPLKASVTGTAPEQLGGQVPDPRATNPQDDGRDTRSIDERPLTRQAFVVSYYHGLPAEEAKQRAKELGKWLTAQGIERARAYLAQAKSGPLWLTVVYFEGAEQRTEVAQKLTELRDVPDANFTWLRKNTKGWPEWMSIQ